MFEIDENSILRLRKFVFLKCFRQDAFKMFQERLQDPSRRPKGAQHGPRSPSKGQRPPQDLVQRQVFMAVVGFRLLRRSKRGPKTHQDGPKTSSRDFGGSFQEWGFGGAGAPPIRRRRRRRRQFISPVACSFLLSAR